MAISTAISPASLIEASANTRKAGISDVKVHVFSPTVGHVRFFALLANFSANSGEECPRGHSLRCWHNRVGNLESSRSMRAPLGGFYINIGFGGDDDFVLHRKWRVECRGRKVENHFLSSRWQRNSYDIRSIFLPSHNFRSSKNFLKKELMDKYYS